MFNWPRLACALSLSAVALTAAAQSTYPAQPIKVVVPFPPGGGTDFVARLLTEKMRLANNWTYVIDNRAGAGGNIGLDAVARSPADGYTLGLAQTANLAINPALYTKMPYDAAKAFVPVAMVAGQPVVLVVNGNSPHKTVADLIAAAKAKPGTVTLASAGAGTVGHLTGELFAKQGNFKHVHIPYRGAGPAATDLMGGMVDYYFATPQTVMPYLKTGKLRALAVSSARRMPVLPDVPTIAESGMKGFDTSDWKMVVAPAGTPPAIVARLHGEVEKALARPDMISMLLSEGSAPMSSGSEAAAQFLKTEQQRWASLVKSSNIKFD